MNLSKPEPDEHIDHKFRIIHEYSMELAYLKYEEIFPGIIRQINKLFDAKGALISIYDGTTHMLEVHYTTLSEKENSRITRLLGKKLIGFKVHVSDDNYKMMTEKIVGDPSSLHQLTFGAIPEIVSRPIEKIFGLGYFVPVVLLHQMRLVGTMVIVLRPGQTTPDREVMLAFAGITANALERKKAEDDLRESESRYRLLADHMYGTIWLMDMNFKTTFISPSVVKNRGFSVQEIMELPLDKHITPESLNLAMNTFSEEKKKIMTDPLYTMDRTLEIEYYRKDGTTYWSENRFSLIRDENGKPMAILGEGRDITDRKQAEDKIKNMLEEKELLLREVYHRIKNNMNTIKGLLSLQISAEDNPATIESLQDAESRVQSMIFLYDRLSCNENYRELSMNEYITSLAEEIIGSFSARVMVELKSDIGDFILNVQTLTPIGIIVNEILTNTMKHAFIGRERGLITLSSSQNNNHVVINIQDDGVGVPETVSFENSTGFGMQLVGMLTEQIGGSIRIERGAGSKFILEFDI